MDIQPQFITRAVEDVAMERARQKLSEGWTPEHDDGHLLGEMAAAAACYAVSAHMALSAADLPDPVSEVVTDFWPWSLEWWKPKDPRRDLVRAAALIVAEIERLDRLPPNGSERGS